MVIITLRLMVNHLSFASPHLRFLYQLLFIRPMVYCYIVSHVFPVSIVPLLYSILYSIIVSFQGRDDRSLHCIICLRTLVCYLQKFRTVSFRNPLLIFNVAIYQSHVDIYHIWIAHLYVIGYSGSTITIYMYVLSY